MVVAVPYAVIFEKERHVSGASALSDIGARTIELLVRERADRRCEPRGTARHVNYSDGRDRGPYK